MNPTLAAHLACDTIRNETAPRSDERVRRTGQVAILLATLKAGSIDRTTLEIIAAADRGVTAEELSKHILRPLVQRGFIRTAKGAVIPTAAAVAHADAIGAWMDGATLDALGETREVRAWDARVGDVVEYRAHDGSTKLALVDCVEAWSSTSTKVGPLVVQSTAKVRVYRAA